MKLLVYTDGSPQAANALATAAVLQKRLGAELTVITIRSGTHAAEPPPSLGKAVSIADREQLSTGLQVLTQALDVLCEQGACLPQPTIDVRELSHGHIFVAETPKGMRVPFYVRYGHFFESLNHEIDQKHYDLVIIAPSQQSRFKKKVMGDTSRKLILELHTSVLIVRNQKPWDRFMVCADGSDAARRQFPLLRQLLPSILVPLEFIYVQTPDSDETQRQKADHCLQEAKKWLAACGHESRIHRLKGAQPAEIIASEASSDATICVGASLRHDLYRRMVGSLAIQLLSRSQASLLVVKALPEGEEAFMDGPDSCDLTQEDSPL